MALEVDGKTIETTANGYLVNMEDWSEAVGAAIAAAEPLEMTEKHWDVIEYLQDKHQKEEPLSIRGIKKSGVINIKEFYSLFPGGPLKKSTLIAGIPKPKSCI